MRVSNFRGHFMCLLYLHFSLVFGEDNWTSQWTWSYIFLQVLVVGMVTCTNLSFFLLLSLLSDLDHGALKAHQNCTQWIWRFSLGGKRRTWMEALTCVICCWKLRKFPPCQSMWCAKCCASNDHIRFHVRLQSLRRASNTRALNMNVLSSDIDVTNL